MICSTVIPTFHREELVARAVNSVLAQLPDRDNFEIIVVNDAGIPLKEAEWQKSPLVTVVNTNRCERSVARNVGAALAEGEWLHFLDDDDYVLPGAYAALYDVAKTGSCVWIYGSYKRVSGKGVNSEVEASIKGNIFAWLVAGEVIPFQTSWLRRDVFYRAGCFDPTICGVGTEDADLGRRIACIGDVGCTDSSICCLRVEHTTTTTDWSGSAAADRYGREKALDSCDAVARLRASMRGDTRLRGLACRAYVASAAENLRKSKHLKAASRGLTSIRLAGFYLFTPGFWRGLRALQRRKELTKRSAE